MGFADLGGGGVDGGAGGYVRGVEVRCWCWWMVERSEVWGVFWEEGKEREGGFFGPTKWFPRRCPSEHHDLDAFRPELLHDVLTQPIRPPRQDHHLLPPIPGVVRCEIIPGKLGEEPVGFAQDADAEQDLEALNQTW